MVFEKNSLMRRVCKREGTGLKEMKGAGRTLVGVVIALLVSFAGLPGSVAQEGSRALDPLLRGLALEEGEVLLGIAGYDGEPLPDRWLALVGMPGQPPMYRELTLKGGAVVSTRVIQAAAGEDLPHLPVDRALVTIPASEAHRSASRRAGEVGVRWASVHFHLRVRDEGAEPVWLITFVNRAQVRVGQVYLSARTGDILRESWPQRPDVVPDKVPTDRSKVSAR